MSSASLEARRPLPSASWRTAGWLVGRTLRILAVGAMTMAHLPIHLAFGMTRRSFAAAVVLTDLGIAVVLALLVPLGYLLEGARFRGYGWSHQVPDGLTAAMLASTLRIAVWGLVGALNAAIWYRFGGFVGVVLAPIAAVLPIVAAAMWIERAAPFGPAEAGLLVGLIALLGVAYVGTCIHTHLGHRQGGGGESPRIPAATPGSHATSRRLLVTARF